MQAVSKAMRNGDLAAASREFSVPYSALYRALHCTLLNAGRVERKEWESSSSEDSSSEEEEEEVGRDDEATSNSTQALGAAPASPRQPTADSAAPRPKRARISVTSAPVQSKPSPRAKRSVVPPADAESTGAIAASKRLRHESRPPQSSSAGGPPPVDSSSEPRSTTRPSAKPVAKVMSSSSSSTTSAASPSPARKGRPLILREEEQLEVLKTLGNSFTEQAVANALQSRARAKVHVCCLNRPTRPRSHALILYENV